MLILMSLLISVGFFTLMERKILSLSQMRLGPNKNFIFGLIQPILDGLKLFKKTLIMNFKSFNFLYQIVSFFMLLVSFLMWTFMPFYLWGTKLFLILMVLFVLGLNSFCILLLGWSSFSKYGFLGSIRSMGQTMSFEVNFSIILFSIFLSLNKMSAALSSLSSVLTFIVFFFISWILIMMESQRAPMDLAEGESELVSGYNTEFSSLLFTYIFLSEYLMMLLLLSFIWVMLLSLNWMYLLVSMIAMLMMRACFPRIRMDYLIKLSWLKLLPFIICLFIFFYVFKFL